MRRALAAAFDLAAGIGKPVDLHARSRRPPRALLALNLPKQLADTRSCACACPAAAPWDNVYDALDARLNRSVAIQVIATAVIDEPELRAIHSARFVRAAQAVARLKRPHILALDVCCAAPIALAKKHASRHNITAVPVPAGR